MMLFMNCYGTTPHLLNNLIISISLLFLLANLNYIFSFCLIIQDHIGNPELVLKWNFVLLILQKGEKLGVVYGYPGPSLANCLMRSVSLIYERPLLEASNGR